MSPSPQLFAGQMVPTRGLLAANHSSVLDHPEEGFMCLVHRLVSVGGTDPMPSRAAEDPTAQWRPVALSATSTSGETVT